MALIPRDLLRNRWFLAGLLLRLLAVGLLAPQVQSEWFTPFLAHTLLPPRLDPWTSYLAGGGDVLAFPYGPIMYALHAPPVLAGALLDQALGLDLVLARVGFGLSLLLADFALLWALQRLTGAPVRQVVLAYWWSPIVLFITYWHGQTDVIPTLFIVLALLAMQLMRLVWGGGLLGLGVAAKLSAGIVAPFLLLFIWNTRNLRRFTARFVAAACLAALVVQGPYLLRPGARAMILGSPEIAKIGEIAVTLGNGTQIFLVPLLYMLLVFAAARIGRMNFDLLYGFIGVSFLVILLFTPASIGWYMWAVPFIAAWQMQATRTEAALGWIFSGVFVGLKCLVGAGAAIPLLGLDFRAPLALSHPELATPALLSLGITLLTASGLALSLAMLGRALLRNDFYRLSRRPLAIGIAGDSGAGKDTLSAALGGLFGQSAVVAISGDDYHSFERKGAMWQTLTHLDPRANDLRGFTQDALALRAGKPIQARRYDHATGRFTRTHRIRANDMVLVSGLHAFYPLALREQLDLTVFLDMHEGLRRHFKLRRDVAERGHPPDAVLESIERRRADFERYVHPQSEVADLCLSLEPVEPDFSPDLGRGGPVTLRLRVRLRHGVQADELARVLIATCGAGVSLSPAERDCSVQMVVDGAEACAEDLSFAAARLVPHLEELMPIDPGWKPGLTGVMQLCVLVQLGDAVARRR